MPFTIPNTADAAFAVQAEPDSRDFDMVTAAFAQTGVVSGCAVTTTGTTNGSVSVAVGVVRIAGRRVAVATGTVAIAANATGNPRLDLITVDTSGTKAVVAGTAAAAPVFPTIPASRVVLAAVYVATGHTTSTNLASNTITDKRVVITDPGLENVLWYGAVGNATSFVLTSSAAAAQGVIVSQLATPTGVSTSTTTYGGVLAAGTYSYRVAAFNAFGQTLASTGVTQVTTGTTSAVLVSWTAVTGASGYRIYGRTSGSELLIYSVAAPRTSFLDTGSRGPNGALPGANTTGPFASAMVGQPIYISDGGAAGVQYVGTVSVFTSATQVTVTPNLSTTVPVGATASTGTDNSTPIDNAVAALQPGSTLYFPSGQYLASTTGVSIIGKSNVTVTGDYATIIGITESQSVIYAQDASQIAIDRLRVQHATTSARNNSGYGINVYRCSDVVVKDCYVFQICSAGILLEAVSHGTVYGNTVTNNLADGIHTTGGSADINVVGNRLDNTGDDGIAFVSYRADGNPVTRFTATGNSIYRCNARGIGIIGSSSGSVTGNTVNETVAAGIIVAQELSYSTYGPSDVIVANNTIIGAATYNGSVIDHAAIHVNIQDSLYPADGITITGNYIESPRRCAFIADNNISNLVVQGNVFVGPSAETVDAFVLANSIVNARVVGNTISYPRGYGLIQFSTLNSYIEGNQIYYPAQSGGGGWGIRIESGTSRIRNNIVIQDPGKTALTASVYAPPTVAAVAGSTGAGTTPPAPVVSTGAIDEAGTVTFGTGSGTTGTGAYVTVTFHTAFSMTPKVTLTPTNAATAVLAPYVLSIGTTSFQIGLGAAAAAAQGNTVYGIAWQTVPN